jgi:hypothetical protein
MEQTIRVTLSGSREGPYIVTEEHPDGSLVVVPDKSEKTNDSETLAAYHAESDEIAAAFDATPPEW